MTGKTMSAIPPLSAAGRLDPQTAYQRVRSSTDWLCEPLVAEDYVIQSMPDASPIRWHIAHVTWFFETFILLPQLSGYEVYHPQFRLLFNSYYNAVGPRWPRPLRGVLSRPTVAEIRRYRKYVDDHMQRLFDHFHNAPPKEIADLITLGCQHEQQHQELMLTDLKHAWGLNPIDPVYREVAPLRGEAPPSVWRAYPEGLAWVGHEGSDFAFDNETPRHRTLVHGYQLANRLVTNRDYLAFINDGGYCRPELWLSEGWNTSQVHNWTAPLYWDFRDGDWTLFTLTGRRQVLPDEPVCHVSFYEADAFARWCGARLPTEDEWETAAGECPIAGHFVEGRQFHPSAVPADDDGGPLYQLHGDVWQWTGSPYIGYPGYRPVPGALGEYNGKFMCNQFVLRGASCATPRSHARLTYRNFFPPEARWQFSGIRLAKELS